MNKCAPLGFCNLHFVILGYLYTNEACMCVVYFIHTHAHTHVITHTTVFSDLL